MENFKEKVTQENVADTYGGRAWEELSDSELRGIQTSRITEWAKKAKEILAEREARRMADIKALDDGSVKGFIVSSGWKYINIGDYVGIQRTLNGIREWVNRDVNACYEITSEDDTSEYNTRHWGYCEGYANDIVTICRRQFKKEDIIIYIFKFKPSCEPESGMVFTENKIYTFDEKKLEYVIDYAEITDVDFSEDSVTITVTDGQEANLYCYSDEDYKREEYSKGVYNLLMDIKDRLSQA